MATSKSKHAVPSKLLRKRIARFVFPCVRQELHRQRLKLLWFIWGPGLIHHSDRGSQYCAQDYQGLLREFAMYASMSRPGNCDDNAPMESFWRTLKNELVHHRHYETRAQAIREITEYIEIFYNRQRRHSRLGNLFPAAFVQQWYRQQPAV